MMFYYHTTRPEKPAVYHTDPWCDDGQKIGPWDRCETNHVPARRRRCKLCALIRVTSPSGSALEGIPGGGGPVP
jgi:hypothetical protein